MNRLKSRQFEGGTKEIEPNFQDIVLTIKLTRHGPKASASGEKDQLSNNFRKSVEKGFKNMDLPDSKGLVHIASSGLPRAEMSAEIHDEKLGETKHRVGNQIKKHSRLETPYQDTEGVEQKFKDDLDKIVNIQAALEPGIRKQIEVEMPDLSPDEQEVEIRNMIDMQVMTKFFEDDKIENPEERNFETSYHDMADALAYRYFAYARRIKNLKNSREKSDQQPDDQPYIQIDVTHSYPTVAFLKKYLVFDDGQVAIDMEPADFFDKIGGIIRESGSLDMNYSISDYDEVTIDIQGQFEEGKQFSGKISNN